MNKTLVTGAGGFIGSHLVEGLISCGRAVRVFMHYNSMGSLGNLELSSGKNAVEIQEGDIRDLDSVNRAMKGCGTVFHLAALIGIPYSYVTPLAYIKTNIEGTYNVLESCRQLQTDDVIVVSTSETYGTAQYVPIDEKHPLVPQSPYAASKSSAEQMALAYHKSFGTPVKVVKPFNVYGPRQSARAIIPTIITQALVSDEIRLGSLAPTRDLTYVTDVVDGFLKIAETQACVGQVTNLGSGFEISIGDLAKKIISLTGKDLKVMTDAQRLRPHDSEVDRLCADVGRARQLIGWQPKVSLNDGLTMTIDWISKHLDLFSPGKYNI